MDGEVREHGVVPDTELGHGYGQHPGRGGSARAGDGLHPQEELHHPGGGPGAGLDDQAGEDGARPSGRAKHVDHDDRVLDDGTVGDRHHQRIGAEGVVEEPEVDRVGGDGAQQTGPVGRDRQTLDPHPGGPGTLDVTVEHTIARDHQGRPGTDPVRQFPGGRPHHGVERM